MMPAEIRPGVFRALASSAAAQGSVAVKRWAKRGTEERAPLLLGGHDGPRVGWVLDWWQDNLGLIAEFEVDATTWRGASVLERIRTGKLSVSVGGLVVGGLVLQNGHVHGRLVELTLTETPADAEARILGWSEISATERRRNSSSLPDDFRIRLDAEFVRLCTEAVAGAAAEAVAEGVFELRTHPHVYVWRERVCSRTT